MELPKQPSLPPSAHASRLFVLSASPDPQQLSPLLDAGGDLLAIGDRWSSPLPLSDSLGKGSQVGGGVDLQPIQNALSTVPGHIPVGAALFPTGLDWEPFGELPFLDLISIYAERALALQDAGAKLLLLAEMSSLGEARAAVLGARQTALPIAVLFTVDEEGRTAQNADLLAAVITLQTLGVAAVGFRCTGGRIDTLKLLGKVAPVAEIPLLIELSAQDSSGTALSAQEMGAYARQAMAAGAGLFAVRENLREDQVREVRHALDSSDSLVCVIKKDDRVLLACADQPFFLSDGHMEFSEPLTCAYDMSEEIINAEDEGCDILSIRVSTVEDAYSFGLNAHMIRVPVCLSADSEEALESALIYYSGRAMVDSLSEVDEVRLSELARGYGAMVV